MPRKAPLRFRPRMWAFAPDGELRPQWGGQASPLGDSLPVVVGFLLAPSSVLVGFLLIQFSVPVRIKLVPVSVLVTF